MNPKFLNCKVRIRSPESCNIIVQKLLMLGYIPDKYFIPWDYGIAISRNGRFYPFDCRQTFNASDFKEVTPSEILNYNEEDNMQTKKRYQMKIMNARHKLQETRYVEAYDILGDILKDMEEDNG